MRLFPKELEISPTDGFNPKNDIFGRKEFGDRLTSIIRRFEDANVLLLDSPWGTGKTTFLKMWQGELAKYRIPSIYFDAFANDYQADAFLAIASQIIRAADEYAPRSKRVIKTFKTKAAQTARIIGRVSVRMGINTATAGLLDAKDLENSLEEIVSGLGEATADEVDKYIEEKLRSYKSDQVTFESFRHALSKLAEVMASSTERQMDDDAQIVRTPLVFIIDELDRCRPTFALEILEKIKHFFSVSNVKFILVGNLKSFEAAVYYAYGNIDAQTYLEKFYHLRILFPSGRPGQPDRGAETYLRFLQCPSNVTEILAAFSTKHDISFWTLERIVAYIKIIKASVKDNSLFLPYLISILCALKVIQPNLYSSARRGTLTIIELDGHLKLGQWKNPYR